MILTAFSAILSHWRRRPVQLAMLLLGLALATALWTGVKAINAEAEASYAEAASVLGQDQLQSLVRADGARFDQSQFVKLRRAGWLVSPMIDGTMMAGSSQLRVIGIDPLSSPPQAAQPGFDGAAALLPFISEDGEFLAHPETVQLLKKVGYKARAVNTLPPGTVVMDIGQAQKRLNAAGQISRLMLWKDQREELQPLSALVPDLTLQQPATTTDLSRLTRSFHLNLTAFGYLSFAVGLFIVHAAVGLAFEQRRTLFRTLRALGLPLASLMILLFSELMLIALVAGIIGIGLGYLVASALLPGVAVTLQGLYGATVSGSLSMRADWWLAGLGIALAGTAISVTQSLWRVYRLPLFSTAKPREWAQASERTLRLQALAGLALMAISAAVVWFADGLTAGFVSLGALLLGGAILSPPILMLLIEGFGRLRNTVLHEWFFADSRQQLPGQSLALMALLLALATNIGVGTMVASFRDTFTRYLDQRLASELYLNTRSPEEAASVMVWLEGKADAVLPTASVETRLNDQPVEIFALVDHATYRDNWPMITAETGVWDKLSSSGGVLINEQLWRKEKITVGQSVTLLDGQAIRVIGVYSDYGNPLGQIIMGRDAFARAYPQAPFLRIAVRAASGEVAEIKEGLASAFNLPPQNIVDQSALKRFSLDIFEKTFTVTAALNVLTLGVAGLAIFASLMTLSDMRIAQLAPVWAAGLTRSSLAWFEFIRTLIFAGLVSLLAIPLGLALAWMLLAVVNVEAFGWRIPLLLFPLDWLGSAALGLVAAALASFLPVRRLRRTTPSELLKVFAHER